MSGGSQWIQSLARAGDRNSLHAVVRGRTFHFTEAEWTIVIFRLKQFQRFKQRNDFMQNCVELLQKEPYNKY
jgi:hypothetical protein